LIRQRLDLQFRGQRGRHRRQQFADSVDHSQRGRVAGLHHGEQHGAAAILPHDVGLRSETVAHVADIANVNRRSVHHLDGKIVERIHRGWAGIEIHAVFELADLRRAGGDDEILLGDGRRDIRRREPLGLHGRGVDIDHDLALFAAVRIRDGATVDGHQARAYEIDAVIEERLFAQSAPAESQLHDGHAGRVVRKEERRRRARRQLLEDRLGDGGHFGHCGFDVGPRLEEDLDDGAAVDGLRFDVLDIVHRGGERPFINGGDALFHFLGAETDVVESRGDYRDIDVGKDIGGSAENDDRGQNQNQQRQYNKRVRPRQRKSDNPHPRSLSIGLSPVPK
jgi:hypothetical protein